MSRRLHKARQPDSSSINGKAEDARVPFCTQRHSDGSSPKNRPGGPRAGRLVKRPKRRRGGQSPIQPHRGQGARRAGTGAARHGRGRRRHPKNMVPALSRRRRRCCCDRTGLVVVDPLAAVRPPARVGGGPGARRWAHGAQGAFLPPSGRAPTQQAGTAFCPGLSSPPDFTRSALPEDRRAVQRPARRQRATGRRSPATPRALGLPDGGDLLVRHVLPRLLERGAVHRAQLLQALLVALRAADVPRRSADAEHQAQHQARHAQLRVRVAEIELYGAARGQPVLPRAPRDARRGAAAKGRRALAGGRCTASREPSAPRLERHPGRSSGAGPTRAKEGAVGCDAECAG
jgi:hypothetical protein